MRILVVTHYFPPEIGAPQARLSEMAAAWAAAGDDVTVLTGMPNHPTGIVPERYRGKWRVRERTDGYRVLRTWLYATANEGFLKKTLSHLSFMLTGLLVGKRATGPIDAVIVSSPTFFSILTGWVQARRHRACFVVEVRDLWPGIFVELGVLTNPRLIRLLERLELLAYRVANRVVVVSEGFKENLVERGVPTAKIITIRNGVDLARFGIGDGSSARRVELGADADDVLVLYIGAHGISHGLEAIADAADLLRDRPIHFAFVGEGAAKEALSRRVRELRLDNVTIRPGVPREEVAPILASADICLVPLRDVPLFSAFIPSKMFEYFAARRAVVGAVRGEPARLLRDGGALVVEPENPAALADAIAKLAQNPALRAKMGETGRRYVEEHFDRRQLAAEYRILLQETCAGREAA